MNRTTHFRDFAKCRKEVPESLVCGADTKSTEGGWREHFMKFEGTKRECL